MQVFKAIEITGDQVVPLAERMRKEGSMLVMIHGYIQPDGRSHISWDYEVGDTVESYYVLDEKKFQTITDIYSTAAEWPERELNELMGYEFEGLDTSRRLFLPEDMLETQGKGQILVTPLSELVEQRKELEEKK